MTEEAREKDATEIAREAKMLGVKKSRISMSGFKDKKPEKIAKEEARTAKKASSRLAKNIAKAKATSKMKPIGKRRGVLVARLRAVKARRRAHTYTNAIITAWLEELKMIDNNPKSWNKITGNGTRGYVPGNKRKRTARDILDGMDLE